MTHPDRDEKPEVLTTQLSDGILIREARGEDAAAMIEYLSVVGGETDFLTFGAGEFDKTVEQERDFVEAMRSSLSGLMLVAMQGERVMGITSCQAGGRARTRHAAALGVSVRREAWGRGLGGAMCEALFDWSSRHPFIRRLHLEVRADNTRAIALYLKLGFLVEGTLKGAFSCRGEYLDEYVMARWIEPASSDLTLANASPSLI